MKLITSEEKIRLLKQVCELFAKNEIAYLTYGSMAYLLLTNDDKMPIRDIDIIIKEIDFDRLIKLLSESNLFLNPIKTAYSIHANSLVYQGYDGKSFDISIDSYEHYFQIHEINFDDYQIIELDSIPIKIMKTKNLIESYRVGVRGQNEEKIEEYKDKIEKLRFSV
ncbi:MAG: hypothetical protein Q7R82_01670 [Candidatus Daviesbacteria bacterium]|nr:hypothetical protein [Candidatus Daviesbacteria bacterium]